MVALAVPAAEAAGGEEACAELARERRAEEARVSKMFLELLKCSHY